MVVRVGVGAEDAVDGALEADMEAEGDADMEAAVAGSAADALEVEAEVVLCTGRTGLRGRKEGRMKTKCS